MWEDTRDARLRREAMEWLAVRSEDGATPLTSGELLDFRFDGEPFRLMGPQRGIRKPAVLLAALSIRTVYTPEGGSRPYEDATGVDGLIRYKWRGEEAQHAENRALREAWRRDVPLVWFFGVGPALYLPVFPVYVVGEEPAEQQFAIAHDAVHGLVEPGSVLEDRMRRYVLAQTKRRLHQPVFRAQVLRAYTTRCAVCSLAHSQLLDAAHTLGDAAGGAASVRNGLACARSITPLSMRTSSVFGRTWSLRFVTICSMRSMGRCSSTVCRSDTVRDSWCCPEVGVSNPTRICLARDTSASATHREKTALVLHETCRSDGHGIRLARPRRYRGSYGSRSSGA